MKNLTWTWIDPESVNTQKNWKNITFILVQEKLNWFEAKDACASRDAILAKPDSPMKNAFIKDKLIGLNQDKVWFGASQHPYGDSNSNPQSLWMYTDGTPLGFTDWAKGIMM